MKNNKRIIWILSIVALAAIFWMTPVWSEDQPEDYSGMRAESDSGPMMRHGMHGGMAKGGMHGKKMMGGMQGMQRMQGMRGQMSPCPMFQTQKKDGVMIQLHQWMKQFMAHRNLFGLSREQTARLDELMTTHIKAAIQKKSDIRIQMMDLQQLLRQSPIDLEAVENHLKKMGELTAGFQMEGLELYSALRDLLDDQQKDKVEEIVGSPFPAPWERMFPAARNDDDDDEASVNMEEDM